MDSENGRAIDSAIFGRRQLVRVLETSCALSLEGGRADIRVRLSAPCGDFSLEPLLSNFHSPPLVTVLPHPNPLRAGVIPQLVQLDESSIRVDVRVGSIHSWIAARHAYSTHGHALVYSTRRRSSWASARAAVCRLLNDLETPQQIRPILLIAVHEGQTESGEMETQIENESREVAESVGAIFVSTKLTQSPNENLLRAWMCFVGRILSLRLENPNRSVDSRNDSDGYATLNEPRRESGSASSDTNVTRRESTAGMNGEFKEETIHANSTDAERRRTIGIEQSQQQQVIARPATAMVCSSSSGSESAQFLSSPQNNNQQHHNHRHPPPPPRRDLTRAPVQVYEGTSEPTIRSPPQPAPSQRRRFGFGLGRDGDSAAVRRRAPPTPRLLFPGPSPIHLVDTAPLATPELIDIAPEYSTVQDADEHIYATLEDVVSEKQKDKKSYKSQKRSSSRGSSQMPPMAPSPSSSLNSEPNIRSNRSSNPPSIPSSTGGIFMRSPVVRVRSTAPCLSPLPSSSGVSSTTTSPSSTSSFRPRSGIFSSSNSRKAKSKEPMEKPEHKSSKLLEKRSSLFFGSRSVTMDVLAGNSMRELLTKKGKQLVHGMKESISAESLIREGKKKKKRKGEGEIPPAPQSGGLVRKVASSFRLGRKGHTTSLAPSPAPSPQPERKQVLKASYEKVATTFTWLPSRSPKRNGRATSAEISTVTTNRLLADECARGGGLPLFLARCVQFIEAEGGLETEGIYRIPGNQSQLAEVEKQFASNSAPDLSTIELPLHVVATALKNFFSQLTEPVLPTTFHDSIADSVIDEDREKTVTGLSQALSSLPTPNRITLSFLLKHLRNVAAAPATAMDVTNLSKVWWPTLFRPEFSSFTAMTNGTKRLQKAAEALLAHSDVLFPEKNSINNNNLTKV
ncbi:unnamed protein product, partial [Mesorhabditis belari]|uniref:Rho-GAP domain-containing protein n=1 Tax=Mesorhabditis belari TaxID=2138241 RepID=A0AAF3FCK6_9BILA